MDWPGHPPLPAFFEGFDDAPDLGEQWLIGRSGPWTGEVSGGVYRLTNDSAPHAVKYIYTGLSDSKGEEIDLADARVTLAVGVEERLDSPHSAAGILYRFNRENTYYASAMLSFWGGGDERRPFLTWAVRDDGGFRVVGSELAAWIELDKPVVLVVHGRGREITLPANGRTFGTLSSCPTSIGDPGIIALGTGCFTFDNFSIYLPGS